MLENWLSKIDKKIILSSVRKDKENLFNNIEVYLKKIPNLKKIDVAIIGINANLSNEIRKSFYALKYNFVNVNIIDLGNVKKNNTNFIIPLLKELLENKIFPLIIGESTDLFYAMYQAYQSQSHQINATIISNQLAQKESSKQYNLDDFLAQEKNHLFALNGIGMQSHFLSHKTMQTLNEKHYSIIHLGALKDDIVVAEPILRDTDVLAFDISICKSTYAPASIHSSPNGINSHEACRLALFAGLSDKLTSFCLMGINPFKDINNQTIELSSQILWYFLEGYNNRVMDFPKSTKSLKKQKMPKDFTGEKYNFYLSNKSGRWWIEMPWLDKNKYKRHYLIPCNPDEFEKARLGLEPISIIKARARFNVNYK